MRHGRPVDSEFKPLRRRVLTGHPLGGHSPDAPLRALSSLSLHRSQGRLPMPIARAATSRAARTAAVRLGAVALTGALLAACGSGSSDGASDSAGGKVTLTVDLFGSFGYKEAGLYAEYEKLHPNVKIKQ